MASQTESQKVLKSFNLRRAATIAHFSLAIGARFHELDGPAEGHTIPLTILTSLNSEQQATVREIVFRARMDDAMANIVRTFVRGTLSERLGVCMIKENEDLLRAAQVLEFQLDHLLLNQDPKPTANGASSWDGNLNGEAHDEYNGEQVHVTPDIEQSQSSNDAAKAHHQDHDDTVAPDFHYAHCPQIGHEFLPKTLQQRYNYDIWMEAERGGENLVERLREAAAQDISQQQHNSFI